MPLGRHEVLRVDSLVELMKYFLFCKNLKFFIFNGRRIAYDPPRQLNSEELLADKPNPVHVDLLVIRAEESLLEELVRELNDLVDAMVLVRVVKFASLSMLSSQF